MGSFDEGIEAILAADPARREMIEKRAEIVKQWCSEHGRDPDNLTMEDSLAIRALPEWREAGGGKRHGVIVTGFGIFPLEP
jgi:hypothetical protein